MNAEVKPMSAVTPTGFRFEPTFNQPNMLGVDYNHASRRKTALHKHYCSYCGASADADGSFAHKGIWACPAHAERAESEVGRCID